MVRVFIAVGLVGDVGGAKAADAGVLFGDSVLGEKVDVGAGVMTVNRNIDWEPIKVKYGKKFMDTGFYKLGAFVGDHVVIGAGNSIQPGTVIPPGKILPACYSVKNR